MVKGLLSSGEKTKPKPKHKTQRGIDECNACHFYHAMCSYPLC